MNRYGAIAITVTPEENAAIERVKAKLGIKTATAVRFMIREYDKLAKHFDIGAVPPNGHGMQ